MNHYNAFPFVMTFDPEADGGPDHFVWMLNDFVVELLSNGLLLTKGLVLPSDEGTITIQPTDDMGEEWGDPMTYSLWNGSFDEIRYL